MGQLIDVMPALQLDADDRATRVDRIRAEMAVADLLEALGVDVSAEDVSDTPRRVARMYEELLTRIRSTRRHSPTTRATTRWSW